MSYPIQVNHQLEESFRLFQNMGVQVILQLFENNKELSRDVTYIVKVAIDESLGGLAFVWIQTFQKFFPQFLEVEI